ncbi:PAS domain S-box protein [Methylophilaceae bacterium]|nr:PAS domain S-box protein [Methylophilaceae bacterium]
MSSSKRSIQEGVESANKVTIQYLETIIVRSVQNPEWGSTHDVIRRFLRQLGYVRSNDIFLYNDQGDLTYQSPPSSYKLEVKPPQWFINFISPNKESNSRLIQSGRLVVQSNASGAIRGVWLDLRTLFSTTLIFFLLFNLFVYWLLGKWLRPINKMLDAIDKIGKGGFDARLPHFNVPEFRSIALNFNAMGSSLQKTMFENKRLALIAQQTADAVIIHDEKMNISFWNRSAERIFGYKKKEVLGKTARLIVPDSLKKELDKNLTLMKKNKFIHDFKTKRVAKNGKLIDVSISASPLIDPKTKKLIGDIVSMRDISERILAQKSRDELKQNRKLTTIIQGHIEDERRSLARELHDELGQYVSAIKIFAQNINNKSEGNKDIKMSASSVTSAANQIYDGMHNIIRKLRPGALDNLGLSETIKDAVSTWKKQHKNLKFSLKIVGEINDLGEAININIYRMIQEAMNNALKHSNANEITIKLNIIKNSLKLEFYDDGVGFDTKILKDSKQFGLIGIKERVQSLKGTFDLQTSPSNGARLIILIPIRQLKA